MRNTKDDFLMMLIFRFSVLTREFPLQLKRLPLMFHTNFEQQDICVPIAKFNFPHG